MGEDVVRDGETHLEKHEDEIQGDKLQREKHPPVEPAKDPSPAFRGLCVTLLVQLAARAANGFGKRRPEHARVPADPRGDVPFGLGEQVLVGRLISVLAQLLFVDDLRGQR